MALPNIYDICDPRTDVAQGAVGEAEFAADLARVLSGNAPDIYGQPQLFFANTHPTEGLKTLLASVMARLQRDPAQLGAVFRLDTQFGGGKTHALIALVHAANGLAGVRNATEFLPAHLAPPSHVRVAAFDGENADPINGRPLADGGRALTPWGEIAFNLAGRQGFELVRRSDEAGVAPGADTIAELFRGEPALILLDELAVYLRKLKGARQQQAAEQLTAFLTGLMKAVETSPAAALVYTLAIGKEDAKARDAYAQEHEQIAAWMAEAESVSARKAVVLDPTRDDETAQVLRRRLFARIDDAKAATVVDAYQALWDRYRTVLPAVGVPDMRAEAFRGGYPLHPELIETLKEKTATLGEFQRVRGMLRLLARTVGQLWTEHPAETYALHTHHIDPGNPHIRAELVTRLQQQALVPAIKGDVAATPGDAPALAQVLDRDHYRGLAPYASYVARTAFLHTLAFNEPLKGLSEDGLRWAVLSPGTDISFIDDARRRFLEEASYLDDRPAAPLRFLAEANLTQLIRRQEREIDKNRAGEVRSQLDDRIREIFKGGTLSVVPFPGVPAEIPDDAGGGRPYLAIVHYDAADLDPASPAVPELVASLYRLKGSTTEPRKNINNVVFVVADATRAKTMRALTVRRMALDELKRPEQMKQLSDHQQRKVQEEAGKAESQAAISIQQTYRHILYPSRNRLEGAAVDLAHTAVDLAQSAVQPGDGQRQVVAALREQGKLRLPEDPPDAPGYIRSQTPLRKGQIATAALRNEYRRDPNLSILVGDDVLVRGIAQGIEQGVFVYRSGDLIWAKGTPPASIKLDEQSFVFTADYARDNNVWPPPEKEPPPEPTDGPGTVDSDTKPGTGGSTGGRAGMPPPEPPSENRVTAEGPLRQALTELWEKARKQKWTKVSQLDIRIFAWADAARLMGIATAIQRVERKVVIEAAYETTAASEGRVTFSGNLADAASLRDFLGGELRAASDQDVTVALALVFADALALAGDAPEVLTSTLSKAGGGAAHVAAVAQGEP